MPIPSKKSNTVPKTAKERIYTELKNWIIDGTLKADEKIFDQEIAQYFSVSRTPVREAFQMLAEQKLITVSLGKESRVAPINPEKSMQIYTMLSELETIAIQFAFPHITDEDLNHLTDLNRRLDGALQENDILLAKQLDYDFHQVFIHLADNDFLTNFCTTLNIHVARIDHAYFREQVRSSDSLFNSVREHDELIGALKNGDIDKAKDAMRRNWMNTTNILK